MKIYRTFAPLHPQNPPAVTNPQGQRDSINDSQRNLKEKGNTALNWDGLVNLLLLLVITFQ